jgi:hypothetical protein
MLNGHAHSICSVCAINLYLHNFASFYAFVEDFEIFLRQTERTNIWQLDADEVQRSVFCSVHATHVKQVLAHSSCCSTLAYCISGLGRSKSCNFV